MKITAPFKGAHVGNITQGFHNNHKALDMAKPHGTYGTWLVAPFPCKVIRVKSAMKFETDAAFELQQGYGVLFQSIEDITITCSYWHCLPFFPIEEGQILDRFAPMAQIGTSGWVESGGKLVPLKERTVFPFKGAHVHWSMPYDFAPIIDWLVPVQFSELTAISLTLKKILSFLKGR